MRNYLFRHLIIELCVPEGLRFTHYKVIGLLMILMKMIYLAIFL